MAVGSSGSTAIVDAGGRPKPVRLLKAAASPVERPSVTTSRRPALVLPPLLRAVVAWALSPASLPWRGDLLRAALAPVVVAAAALTPLRPLPLTTTLLVAGAYLLLVLAAALGRLDGGVRVPAGVLLGLDALHLFWGAHLTSGLGGPVPVVAATAGACLLLRIALLPPLTPVPTGRPTVVEPAPIASAAGSAARPRPGGARGGVLRGHGAERERLELAPAEV